MRRALAASKILRRSATPENTAESGSKCSEVCSASRRASVVLPQPGGPQRIIEESRPAATMRPMGASGGQQMLLADDLLEPLRAKPVGQRTGRLGFEQSRHRGRPSPNRYAACGFPRFCVKVMSQLPLALASAFCRSLDRGDIPAVDGEDDIARLQAEAHGRGAAAGSGR